MKKMTHEEMFPRTSNFGKTQGKALAELQDAISGWLEAARAVGDPVPKPSLKPEPEHYSGKLVLRLPRSLHAKLATTAKQDGVSLNQHLLASPVSCAPGRSQGLTRGKARDVPHGSQKNINLPMDAWDRARLGLALLEIVGALEAIHPDERRMREVREAVRMMIDERDLPEPDHPGDRP